jgi:hypothetical protein
MSKAQLIDELRRLPTEERLDVMHQVLAEEPRENFEALVHQRRRAAVRKLFECFDREDHIGKRMTEEEIIALSLDE